MNTQTISLFDMNGLEALRPAMTEFLLDIASECEFTEQLEGMNTGRLAKLVNRHYAGGLNAFATTSGYTVTYRN